MLDHLIDDIKRLGRVCFMMPDFYKIPHKLFYKSYRDTSKRTFSITRETICRQTETLMMGKESQCMSSLKLYDQRKLISKRRGLQSVRENAIATERAMLVCMARSNTLNIFSQMRQLSTVENATDI